MDYTISITENDLNQINTYIEERLVKHLMDDNMETSHILFLLTILSEGLTKVKQEVSGFYN